MSGPAGIPHRRHTYSLSDVHHAGDAIRDSVNERVKWAENSRNRRYYQARGTSEGVTDIMRKEGQGKKTLVARITVQAGSNGRELTHLTRFGQTSDGKAVFATVTLDSGWPIAIGYHIDGTRTDDPFSERARPVQEALGLPHPQRVRETEAETSTHKERA